MAEQDNSRQRRNRFIAVWTVGTALWLSALLIFEALTRPPPPFALVAPLLVGVPAAALAIGLVVTRRR